MCGFGCQCMQIGWVTMVLVPCKIMCGQSRARQSSRADDIHVLFGIEMMEHSDIFAVQIQTVHIQSQWDHQGEACIYTAHNSLNLQKNKAACGRKQILLFVEHDAANLPKYQAQV